MATIYGANTLSTGYDVDNSLRVDTAANDHLSRSISSAGSGQIFTASAWFKRSVLGQSASIYCSSKSDTSANFRCLFIEAGDRVQSAMYDGGYSYQVETSALLRDTSAWYHIVTAVDTTQSTAANRVKIYINGVLQTSFSTANYPNQNDTLNFAGTDIKQLVSSLRDGSSIHNSGYIAELHVLDGVAKQASDFGEYDSDTPTIWKPKEYDGSYGTNGFYMEFKQNGTSANSSGIGADTSGNDNHFSVHNITAVNQSTDTCTNNFATKNAIFKTDAVFTEGALVSTHSSNSWQWSPASQAFQNGKWYAEVKVLTANYSGIGLTDLDDAYGYAPSDTHPGKTAVTPNGRGFFWYYDDGKIYYNNTSMTGPGSFTDNDILMFAIDMTNNKYHFGKNGSWLSSSDPANNSGGFTHQSGGTWTFFDAVGNGGSLSWNYGSPNHSVSSGNSDAKGHGNFEYSVPSGYFALNTKNLAEFG